MTEQEVRDHILAVPKAELHVHLDGCLRPETIVELAALYDVTLPSPEPDELADYLTSAMPRTWKTTWPASMSRCR